MKEHFSKSQQQQWSTTPSGLYRRVKLAQSDFCRVNHQVLHNELLQISDQIPTKAEDPLSIWLRTEVSEMLVAFNNLKRVGTMSESPEFEGVPLAQAKRGCEQVMIKGLIDQSVSQN